MNQNGLGGKVDSTLFKRISVDTSGAVITLNAKYPSVQFNSSNNIAAAAQVVINENSSTSEFKWRFNISALPAPLEFDNNVRMADPLWNDATKEWTPIDLGEYEAKATYDGTNWNLTITGLFL